MKNILLYAILSITIIPVHVSMALTVNIDADTRHQKMEGFGASGAFNEVYLSAHNDFSQIVDLGFNQLGLDLYRIQNSYQHVGKTISWQATFVAAKSILDLAEQTSGRDIKVLMSAWSPPTSLKSNNDYDGGTLASDGNGFRYDDYAQWWLDGYNYYNNYGVEIDYISMQNEPQYSAVWNSCIFDPTEGNGNAGYDKAFETVWQKFATEKGLHQMPKMIAPEHHSTDTAILDQYIDALGPHYDRIHAFAHHLYKNNAHRNPDTLNADFNYISEYTNNLSYKPIFQTEYGKSNTVDTAIARKLNLAKLMHNALTLEEVSAYFYWGLTWPADDGRGLIYVPGGSSSSTIEIMPEYYAFKHYSAFVHEDWRRLDVDTTDGNLHASAFASPSRDKMTVVIVNDDNWTKQWDFNFNNTTVSSGTIFRSTSTNDCENIGSFTPGSSIVFPPQSITTLDLDTTVVAAPSNPNILMIAIDDLRPQLRTYGHPQMVTPHLDELAQEGYQFNRAYCQQGVCGPSRASIMTGMRPDSTLAYKYNDDFRSTVPWAYTIPMTLSENGYYSTAIGKIFHVINGGNDPMSWEYSWLQGGGSYGGSGAAYQNSSSAPSSMRDHDVATKAVTKLGNLKNQQPFFYGVGFVRPHLPFVAPDEYWNLYNPSDLVYPDRDDEPVNGLSYSYETWNELRGYGGMPQSGPVNANQEQNLIHGYYACVSFVDDQVGRLMEALEAEGLTSNTIVVVWGDHGYHLGNHGQWCKHSNFELDARIPMIIKVPWMPGATKSDALVEALDIYPTLLDLCGVEQPSHLQGESLVPLLQDPSLVGPSEAVSQYPRNAQNVMGYSLRTDRYRYTEWVQKNTGNLLNREIYDHYLDPMEHTNIVNNANLISTALLDSLSAQLKPYIGGEYATTQSSAESFTAFLASSGSQEAVDIIANGEFTSGTANWSKTGSSTLSNPSADALLGADPLVYISNISSADVFNDKLIQTVGYEMGETYTVEFTARADSSHAIRVIWLPPGSGQYSNNVLVENPVLTTNPITFSYPVNPQATVANAQLQFQVGGTAGGVYIDSVRVIAESGSGGGGLTGADALAYADPDGDGLDNVTEYAFNLNPSTSDTHILNASISPDGLPLSHVDQSSGDGIFSVEYVRRKDSDIIEYVPE
ncbi:MAG: hypothetical protein CMF29_07540, partial [Kiritimatiellaceae bacterium]|nr:hypothetical protein [Kiritimatiellaceae bacterium]